MSGETALQKLLHYMQPELIEDTYVFVSLPATQPLLLNNWNAIGTFQEAEGLTVILPKANADQHGFAYQGEFKLISLKVHSSLEAVGLTAAVSSALAKAGISANVVAAFYHDHIFVPSQQSQQALACLQKLTKSNEE